MDDLIPWKMSHGQDTTTQNWPYIFGIEGFFLLPSVFNFLLECMRLVREDLYESVLLWAQIVMGLEEMSDWTKVVLVGESQFILELDRISIHLLVCWEGVLDLVEKFRSWWALHDFLVSFEHFHKFQGLIFDGLGLGATHFNDQR